VKAARFALWSALAALAVVAAACPGGLYVDQGNAYPCDFSLPEPDRDAPCASAGAQWVCGADNRCRPFVDEGWQSGTPDPGLIDGGGSQVLPVALKNAIAVVATDTFFPGRLAVMEVDSGTPLLVTSGRRQMVPLPISGAPPVAIEEAALATNAAGTFGVLAVRAGGIVVVGDIVTDGGAPFLAQALPVVQLPSLQLLGDARGLRVGTWTSPAVPGLTPLAILTADGGAGETYRPTDAGRPFGFLADDGMPKLLDLRPLARPLLENPVTPTSPDFQPMVPVAATADGIFYRQRHPADGGTDTWIQLSDPSDPVGAGACDFAFARHTRDGALWALGCRTGDKDVLSTWRLSKGAPPSMSRAWGDCSPCAGHVIDFMPVMKGTPGVEVICDRQKAAAAETVLVVGPTTSSPSDPCLTESIAAPFDLTQVRQTDLPIADRSVGPELAIGGLHGQVWTGPSVSTLLPLSLDRVPLAIGTFHGSIAAITDRYLALPVSDNGTLALDLRDVLRPQPGELKLPSTFVEGADGWTVLSTADLAQFSDNPDGSVDHPMAVQYAAQLQAPNGDPAQPPFEAEAFTGPDGQLRIIATASDGIYQHLVTSVTDSPGQVPPELPTLTPEPGSPIRSLALDREAPFSDGGVEVKGYVVTSRNVYAFQLGGSPERWTATQVPLPAGEPAEAWMHSPKSSLGRVGYRDGTVYTLPGGFVMADRLPAVGDGGVPRVNDFANLNGWPVALTQLGLFIARPNTARFPDGGMSKVLAWIPVQLPPELRGAGARRYQNGRIEVLPEVESDGGADQVLYLFSDFGHVYRMASSVQR